MFKQRKHKTFKYQPRFSKSNTPDALDEEAFISKWKRDTKRKFTRGISLRTLLIILVLLLICMYVLEKKYM